MKKLTVSICFACITAVMAIASLIVYMVNVGGAGYYNNATVTNFVLYCVLAAVFMVVAAVLANLKLTGIADTAVDIVVGLLQIATPAILALALVSLIAARAEGLGFIYFSNADVIKEVQTPENLSSATGAIANMIVLGVSTVVGIVTAFMNVKKPA